MDISEATDSLRPGEKYIFYSRELLEKGLTREQLLRPTIDGIVIHYRGIDIISVECGTGTYEWHAGGYIDEPYLSDLINKIEKRMNPPVATDPKFVYNPDLDA